METSSLISGLILNLDGWMDGSPGMLRKKLKTLKFPVYKPDEQRAGMAFQSISLSITILSGPALGKAEKKPLLCPQDSEVHLARLKLSNVFPHMDDYVKRKVTPQISSELKASKASRLPSLVSSCWLTSNH